MNLTVSTETYDRRIKICQGCEHFIRAVKICGVCKCVMPIKARLTMTKCPVNKWMREDGKNSNSQG